MAEGIVTHSQNNNKIEIFQMYLWIVVLMQTTMQTRHSCVVVSQRDFVHGFSATSEMQQKGKTLK